MKKSDIAWTDYSSGLANFVARGRLKGDCEISTGCANCYVHDMSKHLPLLHTDETAIYPDRLAGLILTRHRKGPFKRGPGAKPMVFVVDTGDLFHSNVPNDFVIDAIQQMGTRQDINFQVLTKRAERMANLLEGIAVPENIWFGTTTENQAMADERTPHLLRVNARIRFLSVEPMLEPITLDLTGIHWVICGGESGPNRRPFDKEWAKDLHEQCRAVGTAFFFKQASDRRQGTDDLLDGQSIKEWPRWDAEAHGA